jgi:hypothetical protein
LLDRLWYLVYHDCRLPTKLIEEIVMVEAGKSLDDGLNSSTTDSRTAIVRVPRGVDSALFGGWGVRI